MQTGNIRHTLVIHISLNDITMTVFSLPRLASSSSAYNVSPSYPKSSAAPFPTKPLTRVTPTLSWRTLFYTTVLASLLSSKSSFATKPSSTSKMKPSKFCYCQFRRGRILALIFLRETSNIVHPSSFHTSSLPTRLTSARTNSLADSLATTAVSATSVFFCQSLSA